jgi:hypothetical protein
LASGSIDSNWTINTRAGTPRSSRDANTKRWTRAACFKSNSNEPTDSSRGSTARSMRGRSRDTSVSSRTNRFASGAGSAFEVGGASPARTVAVTSSATTSVGDMDGDAITRAAGNPAARADAARARFCPAHAAGEHRH